MAGKSSTSSQEQQPAETLAGAAEATRASQDPALRQAERDMAEQHAIGRQENPGDMLWVLSNRRDDRVVLWETDPRHPGGEAFVGGPAPDYVYRTEEVANLLNAGLLVEVPEPPQSRKKPLVLSAPASTVSQQPGQRVALGRTLDPELFPDEADRKAVAEAQRAKPRELPLPEGITVPTAPAGTAAQG